MDVRGSIRKTYARWCAESHVAAWVTAALLVMALVSVILGIATLGYTFENMLFVGRDSYWDDFFDSVYFSYEDPYTVAKVLYPPLITVIYALIADYLIPRVGGYTPFDPDYEHHIDLYSNVLRDSDLGAAIYLSFTAVGLVLLYILIWKFLKSRNFKLNIWLFALLAIVSYPIVFTVDRGNCILFTALFCLYFVYGYESENKAFRWTAYIALALAIAIKVYPVFFLALFFRNRNWKGFFSIVALSVFLLLFPFVFTDGTPSMLLDTMMSHSSNSAGSNGVINIQDWVYFLIGKFVSDGTVSAVSMVVVIAFELLALYIVATRKEMKEWEVMMLVTSMLVFGPGVGAAYLLDYALIPLLYFVTEERELDRRTLFCAFCFVAALCLNPWFDAYHNVLASLKAIPLLLMTIMIILDQFPKGRDFLARFGMLPGQVPDRRISRAQTN